MRRRYRYSIILLLSLAFFVIAPVVLVYTAGYSYNWKKVRFEKTGLIVLDTIPTGARVSVNEVPETLTTPMTVYRLLPDDYAIKLERTGYLTWRKTLPVHSTETTFVKNLVLFRDVLPRLDTVVDATKTAVRTDGTAAIISVNDKWTELALATPNGKTSFLARFVAGQLDHPEITWSPDGMRLLLTGGNPDRNSAYVYRPDTGESTAIRLRPSETKPLASRDLRHVRWNADGTALSMVTDSGIAVWNSEGSFATPVPGTAGAEDAILGADGLYFIHRWLPEDRGPDQDYPVGGKALWRIPVDGSRPADRLADLDDTGLEFADLAPGYVSVSRVDGGQMKTYSTSSGVIAVQGAGHRVRWERSLGQGRMLVWNDFEVSIMDPSSGRRDVITRLSSPLADCVWHPAGLDIICATAEGVFAAELDDRGGHNIFDLARFPSISSFALDPKGTILYLVGAIGKQRGLYERQL